jgi:lipoate-protein ligase B
MPEKCDRSGSTFKRREDRVGVWVRRPEKGPGVEDKIAAIGIRVRRWAQVRPPPVEVEHHVGHPLPGAMIGVLPAPPRAVDRGVVRDALLDYREAEAAMEARAAAIAEGRALERVWLARPSAIAAARASMAASASR